MAAMNPATRKRLVHGPSHLRALFDLAVDVASRSTAADPMLDAVTEPTLSEVFSRDRDRAQWDRMSPFERKRWLRSKLWHCSSVIGRSSRDSIHDLLDDRSKITTYAQAVRSELFDK
jgi:hypothetical protein